MRLPGCAVTQTDWPSSSQPTFTARCTGCPGPNDASPPLPCMPFGPWVSQFTLTVSGQSYRNGSTPTGAQTIYFEETGTVCDGQKLFRYKGPLQPDKKHEIDLGGHDAPELPITFYVEATPTIEPSARQDAGGDSAAASDGPADASVGCSCALGGSKMLSESAIGPSILAFVLTFVGGVLRRRSRWRR
jgi:hypothetical protein